MGGPAHRLRRPDVRRGLKHLATGRDHHLGLLLWAALACLIAGLLLPTMTIVSLGLISRAYSLIGAVLALARSGEVVLAVIVGLFSVVLPLAKLAVALWLWHGVRPGGSGLARGVARLEGLSRWSMLDVFVVALTILAIEGSLIARGDIGPGLPLFALSILASTLALARLGRLCRLAESVPDQA